MKNFNIKITKVKLADTVTISTIVNVDAETSLEAVERVNTNLENGDYTDNEWNIEEYAESIDQCEDVLDETELEIETSYDYVGDLKDFKYILQVNGMVCFTYTTEEYRGHHDTYLDNKIIKILPNTNIGLAVHKDQALTSLSDTESEYYLFNSMEEDLSTALCNVGFELNVHIPTIEHSYAVYDTLDLNTMDDDLKCYFKQK